MARQRASIERRKGQPPRQHLWNAIRALRTGFTQAELEERTGVSRHIIQDYIKVLLKSHYIAVVKEEVLNHLCSRRTYTLVQDQGVEAPRLSKTGQAVQQGRTNEALWGTLRRMFKTAVVDYRQLAVFAGTSQRPISVETAKSYVLKLHAAGYLECVEPAIKPPHPRPARYRLRPHMDSGPQAPMIQRDKQVFDPNWNRIVTVQPHNATGIEQATRKAERGA